ncbi:MAG TPA: hypothetical protein VH914_09695 [Acidimicrobiia bacterium]|nr:hypothetical protein [Acidimicrobiia bacterium]
MGSKVSLYWTAVRRHWTSVLVTWGTGLGLAFGLNAVGVVKRWPWWAIAALLVLGLFVAQFRAWREEHVAHDDLKERHDYLKTKHDEVVASHAATVQSLHERLDKRPVHDLHETNLRASVDTLKASIERGAVPRYGEPDRFVLREAFEAHFADCAEEIKAYRDASAREKIAEDVWTKNFDDAIVVHGLDQPPLHAADLRNVLLASAKKAIFAESGREREDALPRWWHPSRDMGADLREERRMFRFPTARSLTISLKRSRRN